MRARLPISASRFSSPLAPAETPITAIRPPVASAVEVLGEVRRADELEDHVERAVLGEALGRDHLGAERGHPLAQRLVRTVAVTRAPAARPSWIAAVPTPPAPPCTSSRSPERSSACTKTRVVRGREDLGQPARRPPSRAARAPASAGARGPTASSAWRAAADDRHHALAHARSARHPGPSAERPRRRAPCRGCPAGEPGGAGYSPRRCIMSAPLSPAARTRTSTSPAAGLRIRDAPRSTICLLADGGGAHRRSGRRAHPRSSSATHSMWCVWGNMSTGRTFFSDPARLDELGGVGRQRGGVAGHVDDPLRRGLDDPVDDLLGEPRARRIDDDDVGPPGALDQLGQREAGVAGEELRPRDLVAPRARDRVGDGLLDQLDPPQLAGARGEREARSCRSPSRGRRRAPSPPARRTRTTTP